MKTININLIGEFAKAPEYNKAVIKKDDLNTSTRLIMVIFLVGVLIVFAVSFGVWFVTDLLGRGSKAELKKLKTEHEQLEEEQTRLAIYRKSLQDDLMIAHLKYLARKQINNSFVPWSSVLKELAAKVPKNIIISNIDKAGTANFNNRLTISGVVPASKNTRNKPFTTVSFLILNINEDENSLLFDANIKKIEYEEKAELYQFEIEAGIRKKQEEQENKDRA